MADYYKTLDIQRDADEKLARMADPERLRAAADRARKAGLNAIAKPSDWL